MSEYIMGLGISFEICKLYEELIYLSLCNNEHTEEYASVVSRLAVLIEEETFIYDNLSSSRIDYYYQSLLNDDISTYDAEKGRYASKIRERKNLLNNHGKNDYPFSLNTAIVGKILLDTLVKLEKKLLVSLNQEAPDSTYNLYSFHKTYKYSLIESNDFLERLAVDFNFDLSSIPLISFNKINANFGNDINFDKYLEEVLLIIAKENIITLISNNDVSVDNIYTRLLSMIQLEIVFKYFTNEMFNELDNLCYKSNLTNYASNKYIKSLRKKYN